ncbi:MAG TPA: DUF58 domain-containing protein [Dehalococcoidia bacterium]|nr:DUF58 domain-containing protein [Dehalococcoidia bacterium]
MPKRLALRLFAFLRRNRSLLLALAVFGTMAGLAAVSGYWLFYRAAYVLGGLIPLSFVWGRLNLRGLEVTVERAGDRLQVGQQAEARVRLKSGSFYTRLWLEVEQLTDLPGGPACAVVTLPAHSARGWRFTVPCTRRGVFTVGPIRVSSGDPFGLFRFSRTYGESQSLLVLPTPAYLPYVQAPPAQLSGEGTIRRRTPYVTPNATGIRDYQPGDSYNRIHWRSTARLARLMVKTFEMDPSSDIWLLLDLEGAAQAGQGDESTEEYGVRIAASLGNHFLEENRMLGLLGSGEQEILLEPARGSQQYTRVLEALAPARALGEVPLARTLQKEGRRFGRHTTLIVVTPSTDETWVEALQSLIQEGTRVAVVLLDAGSFGGAEGALLPLSTLMASDVLTYVVCRGDDLALALGPAGAAGTPLGAATRGQR